MRVSGMKVIVGMDSFKGSLSSVKANMAVKRGFQKIYHDADIVTFAMADGGEGTTETLVDGMKGDLIETTVLGPLKKEVTASYGYIESDELAIIEVASACGLTLLKNEELNPLKATSYGVGKMIQHAYKQGARKYIIGLGGSATNDGGVGMLQALGFKFLDKNHKEIELGGEYLKDIAEIVPTQKFKDCHFRVACDVTNQLYGKNGATYVFGPQKGVTNSQLEPLDEGLKHFAQKTESLLDIDIASIEGGGAAGGLGAAFYGYLNGELESGISLILDVLKVEDAVKEANLVITGEGQLDAQTSMGKVPAGMAKLAKKYDLPTVAIAGALTDDAYSLNEYGIDALFSIQDRPRDIETAMDSDVTEDGIEKLAEQIARTLHINL